MSLFAALFNQKPRKLTAEEKIGYLFGLVLPDIVRTSTFEELTITLFTLGRAHAVANPNYRAEVATDNHHNRLKADSFSFRYNEESNKVVLYIADTSYVIDIIKTDNTFKMYKRNLMESSDKTEITSANTLIEIFQESNWYRNKI